MTAVVVGASAGLGRALAEALAAAGHDLVLVSSDARDLEAVASDLRIRHGVRVRGRPARSRAASCADVESSDDGRDLGGPDALLLPIGWTAASDDPRRSADVAARLVRTNLLSVVAIVAELLPELRQKPRASIVGFGSVAAVRGRGANMVYAASKRALQTWFERLAPRLRGHVGRGSASTCSATSTRASRSGGARLCRAPIPRGWRRAWCGSWAACEGVVYHPRAWRLVSVMLPLRAVLPLQAPEGLTRCPAIPNR